MFLSRLSALAAAAALAFTVSLSNTQAMDASLYDAAAFDMAQAQEQHIVVEVFKTGCPTCKLQQPGLKAARDKFPGAKFVKVDFDGASEPVKRFNAVKQSTIIVFKGKTEVARIVGETNAEAIVATIAKGA
jgi:thioredoxin 1